MGAMAQTTAEKTRIQQELNSFFLKYQAKETDFLQQPRLISFSIDPQKKIVKVVANESFAQQEFTDKQVGKITKKIRKSLPHPYNKYQVQVYTCGMLIDDLVTDSHSSEAYKTQMWGDIEYKGRPWVENLSRPNKITHGLYNRHISLWASHGRYYDQTKGFWKWQRPNLFGTTEDLFTQTIVVPFLIPMLEKAGCNVFTPRERDWQTAEIIVDADHPAGISNFQYEEYSESKSWTVTGLKGFGIRPGRLRDNENPFEMGQAKKLKATKKDGKAYIKYQPTIPEAGRYAVYVSYQTLSNSVSDAHYTVYHKGQETHFSVNQKMGGGTWVYLGTFDFDKGNSIFNCVLLTNQSQERGYVTADAVRFGGGMGNIERGGMVSELPRCLEGARYYAQWAGAPYSVYSGRGGTDDYADDINVRSFMTNWLAGGSKFVPHKEGKNVPLELSLAVHSDAGYEKDGSSLTGSLAICTTNTNDGRLDAGISRQVSKDLASRLLTGINRDISSTYHKWHTRYLWDRNYSETRCPEIPSAIIETLSHQNFPDMLMAQDPNFKFTLARSIYKTILRYTADMHGRPYQVAPLQPHNFRIALDGQGKATLSWFGTDDPLEPTASPTGYILYTATGNNNFDNGQPLRSSSCTVQLQPGMLYHFRVSATNRGGESFQSETLSAIYHPEATANILIVNGFDRLAAPAIRNNSMEQGFDLDADIGVSNGLTAGWNGYQQCFDRSQMGLEGPGGLGYGDDLLAGKFVMGNDFSAVKTHAEAIATDKRFNIVSCSAESVETGMVDLSHYKIVDYILGLQKYAPHQLKFYKTFTPGMQQKLARYTQGHGNLLVSGAYLGSDMVGTSDQQWLAQTLKVQSGGTVKADTLDAVSGLSLNIHTYNTVNAKHYAATHQDILQPTNPSAFCAMQYSNGMSAAVAYHGTDYNAFSIGFPLECITDKSTLSAVMRGILTYLLQ